MRYSFGILILKVSENISKIQKRFNSYCLGAWVPLYLIPWKKKRATGHPRKHEVLLSYKTWSDFFGGLRQFIEGTIFLLLVWFKSWFFKLARKSKWGKHLFTILVFIVKRRLWYIFRYFYRRIIFCECILSENFVWLLK